MVQGKDYQAILSSMSHTDQALVTMSELSLDWSTSKGRYDDRRDMLIHALGGKWSSTIVTKKDMLGRIMNS
ncbi:hypothetical protein G4B88_025768 [Cannabis sativa]|uniref:Uncharacterized protein n=1 Tax=Cannabis sativa TaxID=3483 RepID=A0A7J6DNW2_CANSA|nr:hypothetical protein G4B88_025768 [Cannabis sativa]